MKILHSKSLQIFLVCLISILSYSNTFQVPFQFDDMPDIVENPLIKGAGLLKAIDYNRNRLVGYLSFALNYRLHGLDVIGYHIFNLLVHSVNAVLVYLLVLLTFRTPVLKGRDGHAPLIALSAALLFTAHPLQTQAVTYIVQRFTSLAAAFYLLSLALYVRFRLSLDSRLKAWSWYGLSVLSAILAMKTKEIAFTLPLMISLCEFFFFEGRIKRRVLFLIPLLLTMLIIPLSLIHTDKPVGDIIGDVSNAARVQTTLPRWGYLFTQFRVIITYLRLLAVPINQNLDYDYPLYHSLLNAEVLASCVVLLSLFSSALYLLYRSVKGDHRLRVISFGILWFFITLSVESSVIPIADVIFEHRVYLPSAGAFMAVAVSGVLFVERYRERYRWIERGSAVLLISVVLCLSGLTFARNDVWRSELSLWQDVVKKAPRKERAYNAIGHAYLKLGLIDKAIQHFKKSVELDPDYINANNNLGVCYFKMGQVDRAIEAFEQTLRLDPSHSGSHYNIAIAYKIKGDFDRAISHLESALRTKPDAATANNLGMCYSEKGSLEKAVSLFKYAVGLDPSYPDAHLNLSAAYGKMGSADLAAEELTKWNTLTGAQ